jgi:NAD(P)-dependent dehydrogenase (short-subunit alcohol dehydrogenase family)
MGLDGKVILVTGASSGIGAATARYFGAAGASVVLAARRIRELEEISAEIGAQALPVACNVTSFADVEAAVHAALAKFGGLDVLVNNAGLIDPIARLEDSDPVEWCKVVDVNLKGVYHCTRAAHPAMKAGGGGRIINISSGAATNALEGWSHYCATKAAVLSLTRCADKEMQADGIRVIGLSPGTVATPMQIAIRESGINPVSQLDPDAHIPPEWAARTIAFLCGPGGEEFAGGDFSIKTPEGRAMIGLPAPGA